MTKTENEYRVLARRYRPQTFDALVGQDVLVQTLSNAINQGRVAHAFMLTGIRGVGKTTTARIIARSLNCIGEDGKGSMTTHPCGVCESCKSILAESCIDVMEMDAASRTGVDDIRELIESVPYKPVSTRYKVYIIDEVHMLSKNAFNALLKTLEEPPEHVKFIFATTEIRKVPVTILSRCQRFDLRRFDKNELADYLCDIANKESVKLDPEAAAQISSVSGGSARDGLSLLDQAIASIGTDISPDAVRQMLGTIDKRAVGALFNMLLSGEIQKTLDHFGALYRDGVDPQLLLQDLMNFTHIVTKNKVSPAFLDQDPTFSEDEKELIQEASSKLSMSVLARAWQMQLKGMQEVIYAERPDVALEMLFIRMAYVADMPTPMELVTHSKKKTSDLNISEKVHRQVEQSKPQEPKSFEAAVSLAIHHKEILLAEALRRYIQPVEFSFGKIVCSVLEGAPKELVNNFAKHLKTWTGQPWAVETTLKGGTKTLYEEELAQRDELKQSLGQHPVVKEIQSIFPGADIDEMTPKKVS